MNGFRFVYSSAIIREPTLFRQLPFATATTESRVPKRLLIYIYIYKVIYYVYNISIYRIIHIYARIFCKPTNARSIGLSSDGPPICSLSQFCQRERGNPFNPRLYWCQWHRYKRNVSHLYYYYYFVILLSSNIWKFT